MEPRLGLWYQCQFCDEMAIIKGKDIREDGRVWCHSCKHEMALIEQEDEDGESRSSICGVD